MNPFYVPLIKDAGAWREIRGASAGGADWRGYRALSAVKKVCIHHTATNPSGNAVQDIEYVRYIHMDINKWGGIGYNFVITSEVVNGYAVVYMIGDIGSIRAAQINEKASFGLRRDYGNVDMISVSVVGMLHQVEPSREQMRSLRALVDEFMWNEDTRLPAITGWESLCLHKELDATACPGNLTVDKIMKFKYEAEVPPVTPTPVPEPPKPVITYLVELEQNGQKQTVYNGNEKVTAQIQYDLVESPGKLTLTQITNLAGAITTRILNEKTIIPKPIYKVKKSFNEAVTELLSTEELEAATAFYNGCKDIGTISLYESIDNQERLIEQKVNEAPVVVPDPVQEDLKKAVASAGTIGLFAAAITTLFFTDASEITRLAYQALISIVAESVVIIYNTPKRDFKSIMINILSYTVASNAIAPAVLIAFDGNLSPEKMAAAQYVVKFGANIALVLVKGLNKK